MWETVIGLEVHVELSTKTKIFCGCSTSFGAEPNTQCCPVCMGFPGALPVLNRQVLYSAVMTALALHCTVAKETSFDRKNYFYPDLPKGYQISQLYRPIGQNGYLTIETPEGEKRIGIHELHMEEDAGKLIHSEQTGETYPDFNRAGVPLLEIVSEPELRDENETVAYLKKLKSICEFLKVSDCKMQEGSMRVDVNLSVRKKGESALSTRTETKNLNSFRAVAQAIQFERNRQISLLENGERVRLETRRFSLQTGTGTVMRSKEEAMDYRYFPEPDLPEIHLSMEEIIDIESQMPELADAKKLRYLKVFCLSEQDSAQLTGERALSEVFEQLLKNGISPKDAANWLNGPVSQVLSELALSFETELPFSQMAEIIRLVSEKKVNRGAGIEVLSALLRGVCVSGIEFSVSAYIKEHGMFLLSDNGFLKEAVEKVLKTQEAAVLQYRNGKEKVFGFLVGQVMKETRGRVSPESASDILKKAMAEDKVFTG